jgi:ABC-type bacteriocin/lantibiotic exporter with double-glycine peptidase domain
MIQPLQRFFRMLEPYGKAITNLYVFAIISGLVSLSLPLGIQAIINLIQGGELSASWVLLVVIVLLGYLFNSVLQIIQLRITEDLQKDIFTRSAFEFSYRIPRIRMDALHNQYAPELMNRFFDTISIQKGVSKILLDFTSSGLQIFFGLILLSFYHPFFIVFSVLVVMLVFVIGNHIFKRGLKSSIIESKYKYKVAFWLEEIARTNTTFKLSCDTSLPIRKTDELVDSYLSARETHFRILLRQYYLFIIFKLLVAAGFLVMGGILVINQQMNIGQFVAAEIVVLLLISSSEKLLLTMESVYDLLTSIEKIGEVTDMPLEKTGGHYVERSDDEQGIAVQLHDVYFKYQDSSLYSLSGLNLEIASNEKVCLTGSNGSGKATLLKLMTSFFEPEHGTIIYDGLPLKNYDIVQLRSVIAECISDDRIFDGTLIENLTIGKNIDFNEVKDILINTGLSSFVANLPQGYLTLIGPHGNKIPGSVSQKIILARNLLKKPRLLIVEDIFKNLEKDEKLKIFRYILNPSKKRTIIVVSKDPDIISLADKVIHLNDGKITNITIQNKKKSS